MNQFDKIIEFFSPKTALERASYREMLKRHYDAAGKGRRNKDWKATNADANRTIGSALSTLRARSRDMGRNNLYARRAVRSITANTIGTGMVPTIETNMSPTREKRIMEAWKKWAGKRHCDAAGKKKFTSIQKLVVRTMVESGECLILRRRVEPTDKNPLGIELQVLEPDFIDTTRYGEIVSSITNLPSQIVHGVQIDASGKVEGYYLYYSHPGADQVVRLTSRFVPAEDVIHVYSEERPGQVRGVPWLVAPLTRLKDYDEYEDAELFRQKIAACFAVFVEDANPAAADLGGDDADSIIDKVQPGIIELLPPGKRMSFANPPTTQNYDAYSKRVLQGIAASIGVSYEVLTGDLSNVNFSSARMGWLEFARNIKDWQEDIVIPMMCDRVWEWFIQAYSIAYGGSQEVDVSWTPPRREMIDPKNETEALKMSVRNGFISQQEAIRQLGYDPEDVLSEIVAWNEMTDESEVVLDTDPRKVDAQGRLAVMPVATSEGAEEDDPVEE